MIQHSNAEVGLTSDDILEYGLIPELVGRLPVVSSLSPLDESGLVNVLTLPKNALVKQFESLFQMENCEMEIYGKGLAENCPPSHGQRHRSTGSAFDRGTGNARHHVRPP